MNPDVDERPMISNSGIELDAHHGTINICKYIREIGMRPKTFLQNLLSSSNEEIVKRRQYWGTSTGWLLTEKLILTIKSLVIESEGKDGVNRWNAFILNEVSFVELPQHDRLSTLYIRRIVCLRSLWILILV